MFSEYKTLESLDEFKKNIDEQYARRREVLKRVGNAMSLSEKSFGFMKEAFENLSPYLFESKSGKKLLLAYINTIKNDKNLCGLHSIYESVRKTSNDADVDHFVSAISSTDWGVDKKTVGVSLRKLGNILSEAYLIVGDGADKCLPNEDKELSRAVEFIAENKQTKNNITEFSVASKIIKNNISMKKPTGTAKSVDIDEMANKLIDEFNEKYTGKLDDDELSAIKEVSEAKDVEHVFNKYKKICNSKLEEQKRLFEADGKSESAKRINAIQESLLEKNFSKETINEDITNLLEMSKLFD